MPVSEGKGQTHKSCTSASPPGSAVVKFATVPETIGSNVENMEFTLATSVGVRFERLLAVSLHISRDNNITIGQGRTQRRQQGRRMASEHGPKRGSDIEIRTRECLQK